MIQRKQTLFLLAVFIIGILMLFIPFQSLTQTKMIWSIHLLPVLNIGVTTNGNIYAPLILNLLVITLSIATIFQFKNRPLQYKLANVIALLNVFIVGLFFLLSFVTVSSGDTLAFSIGAFLPILSIICAFLAAHFIKKDEQLVRSADRIR